MADNLFISVVMPAYNAAQFIEESIKSLQEQTFTDWELIVIDDGSTDDTATIVKQLAVTDRRMKYFYQQNKGQGAARNAAIKYAKTELIAFLDADDKWMPDKLEKQNAFIRSTNADLVFADVIVIDEAGIQKKETYEVGHSFYKGEEGLLAFFENNKAPLLTVLVKKEALLKVNGFEERNGPQYGEDYDLWIRMLQSGAVFAASNEKLAAYRQHGKQTTRNKKIMMQVIERLHALKVSNVGLEKEKNRATMLWIRRYIRSVHRNIDKEDVKHIIALYPSFSKRFFLAVCNSFLNTKVTSNIILLFSRGAIK